MKNIILQHFDGELRPLDKLSMKNIQAYAEMVGAEYKLIVGKPFRQHLTAPCQKVYMIDEVWDKYNDVLMLDIDMFAPKGMTENIFALNGVGLYEDTQKRLHSRLSQQHPFQSSILSPYWGGAIYKLSKRLRRELRAGLGGNESWMNPYNRLYNYEDEGIIHTLAWKAGTSMEGTILDRKWCQCSFLPNPEKAGFIHIRTKITPQGPKREKMQNYEELVSKGIL